MPILILIKELLEGEKKSRTRESSSEFVASETRKADGPEISVPCALEMKIHSPPMTFNTYFGPLVSHVTYLSTGILTVYLTFFVIWTYFCLSLSYFYFVHNPVLRKVSSRPFPQMWFRSLFSVSSDICQLGRELFGFLSGKPICVWEKWKRKQRKREKNNA